MPDEALPGKQPVLQRASTVTSGPRRPGSVRVDRPILESVTRRAEEHARGAEAGDPDSRNALFGARSESPECPGPDNRPLPSPLRPRAPLAEGGTVAEEDDRWLQNWQANEIRWLTTKVEQLERQLRHRKIVSAGAVAVGGLALMTAVAVGIALQQRPEVVVAEIEAPLAGEPPFAATSPAGSLGQAAPPQADLARLTPRPAEPTVGEAAGGRVLRDEQAPDILSLPVERSPTAGASPAGGPGRDVGARISPGFSAQAGTAPAPEGPGEGGEPWQVEAEQALMALIEPDSPSGSREAPGQSVEVTDLLSQPERAPFPGATRAGEPLQTFGRSDPAGLPDRASADNGPYAATASVNLRDAPSTEAEVLTVVGEGDRVQRLGSEGDWLLVRYDEGGGGIVTGWVYGRFLHRAEDPLPKNGASARSGG